MEHIAKPKNFIFSKTAVVIIFFWILYVVFTFLTPQTTTSREQLKIGDIALSIIRLTVALSYLALWLFAGSAAWYLRQVSEPTLALFKKYFSIAIAVLLIGMILSALLSTIRSFFPQVEDLKKFLTISLNLSYVVFPIVSYYLMLLGLRRQGSGASKESLFTRRDFIQATIGMLMLATPFIWFVFTNINRLVPFSADTPATYYLSDPLIWILVIIPTIIGWILGLLVALRASDSFEFLEEENIDFFNGIFFIVLGSIILQALISIGTERLYNLGLGVILLLIYLFIAVQLVGFALLGRNVRKLPIDTTSRNHT